jgi:mono/diheme cytochrome c family protein
MIMNAWKSGSCWAYICSSLIGLLAIGCASMIAQPTESDRDWAAQRWPSTTVDALNEGRSLYVRKCSGCHSLYVPSQFGDDEWREAIVEMRDRSGIDQREAKLILRYVITIRHHGEPAGTTPKAAAPAKRIAPSPTPR